jgi:capsular polysaccharide biosynthesis protein
VIAAVHTRPVLRSRSSSLTAAACACLAIVGLGAGAGAAVAAQETRQYQAAVVVDVNDNLLVPAGTHYLPDLAPAPYVARALAPFVTAPGVIDPVVTASHKAISASRLRQEVSAQALAQGTTIVVRVNDHNARAAARYADAVADQFASYVVTLNTDATTRISALSAHRVGSASIPTQPLARPWGPDIGNGALAGLAVALVAMLVQLARRRTRRLIITDHRMELAVSSS